MGFHLHCSCSENLVSETCMYLMTLCYSTKLHIVDIVTTRQHGGCFLDEKPLVMYERLISPRGILVGMSSGTSKRAFISSFRLRDCPLIIITAVKHFCIRLVGNS
jgi:hypothetical protein